MKEGSVPPLAPPVLAAAALTKWFMAPNAPPPVRRYLLTNALHMLACWLSALAGGHLVDKSPYRVAITQLKNASHS